MNTRLLRRVAKKILAEPKKFNMKYWHMTEDGIELPSSEAACGTTHCIGGWAQVLSKSKSPRDTEDALGVSVPEWVRLCYVDDWPKQFRGRRNEWNPTAKQAAARIEHFIKTKGAE